MSDEQGEAAAAGVLGGDEETYRALLQSIVDVARAIFGAEASSVFLYDEDTDELVFEAVSGQGGDTLVGTRFPSSTGIAGFALVTRQPLVVDDLSNDPRFSRERAASTGYVPNSIVASPLLHDERTLGVLSVLDHADDRLFGVAELELLSRFSTQAAIGLDLLLRARRARAALAGDGSAAVVARVASLLEEEDGDEGLRLLEALERLLASHRP
ncbi:MAG TPA: GAF domain-containing protein [Gaiella sp.]|nr:GAF domain-containing protein [Gaiella sp.]